MARVGNVAFDMSRVCNALEIGAEYANGSGYGQNVHWGGGYGQSAQCDVDMARMRNAAWRITVEAVEKQMPQYPLSRLHTQVSTL